MKRSIIFLMLLCLLMCMPACGAEPAEQPGAHPTETSGVESDQEIPARDLLNQLKNLVFSLKYDKLEKVYKQETARLAA